VLLMSLRQASPEFKLNETRFSEMVSDQLFNQLPLLRIPFLTKLGQWLSPLLLVTVDYLTIIFTLIGTFLLRNALITNNQLPIHPFNHYIYLFVPVVYIGLITFEGLYTKRLPFWQNMGKFCKVTFFATLLTTGLLYFEQVAHFYPRVFLGLSFLTCFTALLVNRYLMRLLLAAIGLWKKPTLLIGAGKTAEMITAAFQEDAHIGYEVIGIFDDNHLRPLVQNYQYLGGLDNLERVVRESAIQDVLIALPGLEREKLLDLIYRIQPYVKNISLVPDLYGVPLSNIEVNTYFNQKTMTLTLHNNFLNLWSRSFKRIFDIVAGMIIIIPTIPILALLIVLIKWDSRGPAFHNATRIGKNGKKFICYKFRTMHVDGDAMLEPYFAEHPEAESEWERFAKLKGADPRVTQIGKLLRKYSLDELPQILNVLIGNMSLVGPRPYLPRERDQMNYFYDTIVEAKPGITGLWQISGRNDVEFTGRLELDVWYVRNWSFWLDVAMLLKTVKVVFGKLGAY
jgi:Undecaprenyl-phosphate galactose phosphotransferase WbaP